ncbi:DUF2946 family protein [Luteimonas terricola]|nr:DUF2946 family protein [Luteimonas terricola]
MKRSAFHEWMGRIGLAAALLLVLVPTAGRVIHASMAGGAGHAANAALHGAAQAGRADHDAGHARHGGQGGDVRPAIGDPDCDYCPLLASMATSAGVAFAVAHVPPAIAPVAGRREFRQRWRHPNGLGSRGPPRRD